MNAKTCCRRRWDSFSLDPALVFWHRHPSDSRAVTAEQLEVCALTRCHCLPSEPGADVVATHAVLVSMLSIDRAQTREYTGLFADAVADAPEPIRRLVELELLDDAADEATRQEAAAELYTALLRRVGVEHRWTMYTYMECARHALASGDDESARTLFAMFVARFGASKRPLTRLLVSCALDALASIAPSDDDALTLLERAALHNDVAVSAVHFRALRELAGHAERALAVRRRMPTAGILPA